MPKKISEYFCTEKAVEENYVIILQNSDFFRTYFLDYAPPICYAKKYIVHIISSIILEILIALTSNLTKICFRQFSTSYDFKKITPVKLES